MVSFTQIPTGKRLPGTYIEVDSSQAVRGLPGMPHKLLAIGQRLASGTVAANVPYLITDPEIAAEASGRGSMLHAQALALRDVNDVTEFWGVGLDDDGAGVKAVQTVAFAKADAGADFGAGVVNLWLGFRRVRAAVTADTTPTEIVAALVAAATDPMLPAVLAVDGADDTILTLTAKHAGAVAGAIDVRVNFYSDERLPVNLTATVATRTAGAGDPSIDTALAAVAGDWWTGVTLPYLDGANYTALHGWLQERFDAQDMRDGKAYSALTGTVTGLFTWGESVNGEFITTLPAYNHPLPVWEIAARYAGIGEAAFAADPARQLNTLSLGIPAPSPEDRPTDAEQELLLHSGISSVNFSGGEFRLGRCITNYQVSPAGAEDTAYLDLPTIAGIAYLRWSEDTRMTLRFPRHKLASNDTRADVGQAIATPKLVTAELIALYREWEAAGLVEDTAGYIKRLNVARASGDPNRLNALQTPDIINNFYVFAALFQFRL